MISTNFGCYFAIKYNTCGMAAISEPQVEKTGISNCSSSVCERPIHIKQSFNVIIVLPDDWPVKLETCRSWWFLYNCCSITDEIQLVATKYNIKTHNHTNDLIGHLYNNGPVDRRLRRTWPADLVRH
jgi:hypothetical protein